jgi:FkbM family methyltransferase
MVLQSARTIVELIWNHPANRGRRMRTLARAIGWQAWKRTVGRPLTVRYAGGKVRCYPDSSNASNLIYFNGLFDPHEMLFFRHYLRRGDNVIDAGANVGLYSLLFAELVGRDGKILAFEPDPICADRFRENVRLNGLRNVRLEEAAVSDSRGTVEFSVGEDAAGAFAALRTAKHTRTVPTVRIATELGDIRFAAGKMDVEGAEPLALAGAQIEKHNPPVWTIELTRRTLERSGTSLEAVIAMLKESGFSLWSYEPDARELVEWTERPRKPGLVGDAIAIADDHLSWVQARVAAA